jgi:DNA helicase II / ATP-dependent DNA helicase PcrA
MPVEINITDDDVAHAERLLLPDGKTFDTERRVFLRRFDTLDLQAVPGSGKTTALLAKLVILERYLPFEDGSGILVISHTNAAVDEIKRTIDKHCPKLFSYPSFVGTIQRFVDQFLAIPCYTNMFKRRPIRIDDEIYSEKASKFSETSIKGLASLDQTKAKYYLNANENCSKYRFSFVDGRTILTRSINANPLNIKSPKKPDWSDQEKQRVREWLTQFKKRIMQDGILCFDDAYYLANLYLSQWPKAKTLMQKRFRYVFVDEMQDMGKHQHDLLEELFFDGGNGPCRYQRIGDRNQAIHAVNDFDVESAWQDRDSVLSFANSYRLSSQVATIVEFFALDRTAGFRIKGLGEGTITPHLIIFDNDLVNTVVAKFSSILGTLIDDGKIPRSSENVFKAVAWNSVWNQGDDQEHSGKLRLVDYCPTFQRARHKPPLDHRCLDSYPRYFDRAIQTFDAPRKSIINAFLKILRLEEVQNPDSGSYFTANSLIKHLRESHSDFYEYFKLRLYEWSLASVKSNGKGVAEKIRQTVPMLLQVFGKEVTQSQGFINQTDTAAGQDSSADQYSSNIVNMNGFAIELATVHSVKGQTHTATLYLESSFHSDGRGETAKSYESQRLSGQFLADYLSGNEKKRVKQSAKMVYVGFSRPTHLLCFAVHKDRFDKYLTKLDTSAWEIIRIHDRQGVLTDARL